MSSGDGFGLLGKASGWASAKERRVELKDAVVALRIGEGASRDGMWERRGIGVLRCKRPAILLRDAIVARKRASSVGVWRRTRRGQKVSIALHPFAYALRRAIESTKNRSVCLESGVVTPFPPFLGAETARCALQLSKNASLNAVIFSVYLCEWHCCCKSIWEAASA